MFLRFLLHSSLLIFLFPLCINKSGSMKKLAREEMKRGLILVALITSNYVHTTLLHPGRTVTSLNLDGLGGV